MEAVSSYINKMQLPPFLGRRIRRHYRHYFANKSCLDEGEILNEMSTALRKETSQFVVAEVTFTSGFFFSFKPPFSPSNLFLRSFTFKPLRAGR